MQKMLTEYLKNELRNQVLATVKDFVDPRTFAVLFAIAKDGEIIVRPIGGKWGSGITDAIREIAGKYPGCKMQLFERCSEWKKYFEGIVEREQVLPYAEYSPETRAALEEIRQKVLGCRQKELDK